MSRGPGAVEGRLREIFGNNPTGVFSTGRSVVACIACKQFKRSIALQC